MKKIKLLSVLCIVFLAGCMGPPSRYRVNLEDPILKNNSGIVFGRITSQRFFGLFMYNSDEPLGKGLGFKNLETNERFTYIGAKYFEMMLPQGTYALDGIGSPSGSLSPKGTPFTFSVKNKSVTYIGSIIGDRDLYTLIQSNKLDSSRAIPSKKYGQIEYFIVDEGDAVIDEFLKLHPEIDKMQIKKAFMK